MDFGFTNSKERFNAAVAYKKALMNDHWKVDESYKDRPTEEMVKLNRGGFIALFVTRKHDVGKWKFEAAVSLWGPDGLVIVPPEKYNWKAIRRSITICGYCESKKAETFRVGFAGRCCSECLDRVRKKVEYPGWCS